jgi:archaellum component FlaC
MLKKLNEISEITESNNLIRNSIEEIKKRIEFGEGEYEKLKRKYRKLKKEMLDQSNSSFSSMHEDH